MATVAKPERRRLSPEARRALILDHTANLVAREGVAQLSIEQIGKEAGISKSLVYAYFPNLTELLRELYQREMRRIRRSQAKAAEGAQTFEDLVRWVTHAYLSYMDERRLLIERLQAEPSVSEMDDPTEFSRDRAVDYLTETIIQQFDLPPVTARAPISARAAAYSLPRFKAKTCPRRRILDGSRSAKLARSATGPAGSGSRAFHLPWLLHAA